MSGWIGFLFGLGVAYTCSVGFFVIMIMYLAKPHDADIFEPAATPVRRPGQVMNKPSPGRALFLVKDQKAP